MARGAVVQRLCEGAVSALSGPANRAWLSSRAGVGLTWAGIMFTCERCGAGLPPNTDQCAYCGTVSAPARAQLQAEAARLLHASAPLAAQAAIARRVAQTNTEQAATRALMWGLVSFIFICLPFPSVLAILACNRAQRLAREGGAAVPTRARVGFIFGALTGLGFIALFIYMCVDIHANNVRVAARKAELVQVAARHQNSPALDHELACALAESSLLTDGFAGNTDVNSFHDFECAGALNVQKDRAELRDFNFRTSSTGAPVTATICFKHGSSWFVERVGVTSCEL